MLLATASGLSYRWVRQILMVSERRLTWLTPADSLISLISAELSAKRHARMLPCPFDRPDMSAVSFAFFCIAEHNTRTISLDRRVHASLTTCFPALLTASSQSFPLYTLLSSLCYDAHGLSLVSCVYCVVGGW